MIYRFLHNIIYRVETKKNSVQDEF